MILVIPELVNRSHDARPNCLSSFGTCLKTTHLICWIYVCSDISNLREKEQVSAGKVRDASRDGRPQHGRFLHEWERKREHSISDPRWKWTGSCMHWGGTLMTGCMQARSMDSTFVNWFCQHHRHHVVAASSVGSSFLATLLEIRP